jgi:P-type E1-E2 ATPase
VLVALGVPLTVQTYNFLNSHFHQSYLYQDSLSISTVTARTYASFYLLNNSFIPLDLVVMIDTAKIIYTFWVECDVSIYGVSVRNMSLHEDLAQVEYLFCDKTGTLTQNELRFRGLCLRGQSIV